MYLPELKLEIVQRYLGGDVSLTAPSTEYKINKGDFQKWRDAYLEHGFSVLIKLIEKIRLINFMLLFIKTIDNFRTNVRNMHCNI